MADQSTVRAPFDDADANIIVRSSDGVDFRLYKNVLAKASPVFRDMFTLPASSSSSSESPEDPQTISLSENAETLDALFRLCYPVEHPVFTAFEHVRAVLEAAEKYDMTSLVGNLEEYFVPFLDSEPLRTYATGYFLQSREIARAAAKRLLEDPEFAAPDVPPPSSTVFLLLPCIPSSSIARSAWLQRLLRPRTICSSG
ncbi:hypothetical protein C8Q74DRAFT_692093 [Fomes fomentarius]|nr:hypothetical protein C8Q74DRAFT_692093 [Fomes fomentarius]